MTALETGETRTILMIPNFCSIQKSYHDQNSHEALKYDEHGVAVGEGDADTSYADENVRGDVHQFPPIPVDQIIDEGVCTQTDDHGDRHRQFEQVVAVADEIPLKIS